MNTSLAFDTYSYVRKLRDAGVEEEESEDSISIFSKFWKMANYLKYLGKIHHKKTDQPEATG